MTLIAQLSASAVVVLTQYYRREEIKTCELKVRTYGMYEICQAAGDGSVSQWIYHDTVTV